MFFKLTKNDDLIDLKADQVVGLGELTDPSGKYITGPQYHGKFLKKGRRGSLVFGVCVNKGSDLIYRINEEIDISYNEPQARAKYKFRALVTDTRRSLIDENGKGEFDIQYDMLNELNGKGLSDIDKWVLEVRAVSKPVASGHREFFRLPLQMAIYYKAVTPEYIENLKETDLKFEAETAKRDKEKADSGLLQISSGYSKLLTSDVSAGGFMFRSPDAVEPETYMECIMIVDKEALPVIAKTLRSREDEVLGGYFIHTAFTKISEPVRDRLMRYLLNVQQKQRNLKFARRQ